MVKGGRTPCCSTMTRGTVVVKLILHMVGIGRIGVILLVATVAIVRRVRVLTVMALHTTGILMSTGQRKMRCGMIKSCGSPSCGRMACIAELTDLLSYVIGVGG
jgi:hypothetical protein